MKNETAYHLLILKVETEDGEREMVFESQGKHKVRDQPVIFYVIGQGPSRKQNSSQMVQIRACS